MDSRTVYKRRLIRAITRWHAATPGADQEKAWEDVEAAISNVASDAHAGAAVAIHRAYAQGYKPEMLERLVRHGRPV